MGILISSEEIKPYLEEARREGKRIVFTNGCFDILHAGHVRYLKEAKALGDILIVGLNSDISVQLIKGSQRPICHEDERAEVLAAIGCVDYVILFDDPTPLPIIEKIEPDILVKGEDWKEEAIVGREFVEGRGGKVIRIPLKEGVSTTAIIKKIVEMHQSRR